MKNLLHKMKTVCAAAALIGIGFAATPAHATVIDTFGTTAQSVQVLGGVGSDTNTVVAPEAIGGYRTLSLNVTASTGNDSKTKVNLSGTGTLDISNDTGTVSETKVTWDSNGAGLGGLDLTTDGSLPIMGIGVNLHEIDLNGVISFAITDMSDVTSMLTKSGLTPGNVFFSFADFIGTADLTSVKAISMSFTGPASVDASIELVDAPVVPEPATLSLLGIGLSGIGLIRRRRRMAA